MWGGGGGGGGDCQTCDAVLHTQTTPRSGGLPPMHMPVFPAGPSKAQATAAIVY
jgi:hypothetical protein